MLWGMKTFKSSHVYRGMYKHVCMPTKMHAKKNPVNLIFHIGLIPRLRVSLPKWWRNDPRTKSFHKD